MKREIAKGRKLARHLPAPKVIERNGIRVVTQAVDGLKPDELVALSDYYRERYGDGSVDQ